MARGLGIVLIILLVGAAFIFSCIAAASDAQGAVVFLLSVPFSLLLLTLGLFFAVRKPVPRSGRVLAAILGAEGAFLLLFLVSAVTPPLGSFAAAAMSVVSKGFTAVTGLSPYAWARRNQELAGRIERGLGEAPEVISAELLSPGKDWERLCFFGPYTDDAAAAKTLGFLSATMERSRVRDSDAFTALVYLGKDGSVLELVDVRRSSLDFTPLSGSCLSPADFPITVAQDAAGRRVASSGARRDR